MASTTRERVRPYLLYIVHLQLTILDGILATRNCLHVGAEMILPFFTGVLKFARLVKMYETQDPEIAAMSAKLKSLLLPPLSTPPIGGAIPAS